MNRFLSFFFITILLLIPTIHLNAQWKQVNLGPSGGKINSISVINSDIFAGTGAGINLSTNNGSTWANVNSSITLCFASIGVNIFAGTSSGVIISSDNGNTWTTSNSGMSYYTTALAVNDTVIFAGTSQNGVFRSTNNGTNWTAVDNGLGDFQNQVTSLAVIPNGAGESNIYAGTAAGLCLSTDNGNNWSTVVANNLSSLQYINCITGNGSTIFVGTPGGIIRSTDKGSSWGKADTGLNYGTSIFSILVNNSNIFIGTTVGVYISKDDGGTWVSASNGLPASPSQVYSIAAGTSGTNLYAATNNGVYLSTNEGISWTVENSGSVGTEVYSLTGRGSKIFAVIKGSPIYVSTNYGATWNAAADSGLGSKLIPHLFFTESNLYAATYDSGLYKSSNNGENWSLINGGVMDTLHPYNLIQSGSNLVVSTYNNGIYFSSNNGVIWKNAGGNIPQSISVLSVINSNIFAVFYNGMYLSTDNGENWTQLNDFQSNGLAYSVGLVSSDSILFTAREPVPIVDTVIPPPGGLYSSTDNGKTWVSFHSNSLPIAGSYVFSLVAYGSYVFVAPGDVLFGSTDNGNNWNKIGDALSSGISSVFVNDSSVFAGTYEGIWQIPLSDIISAVKQPTTSSLPMSLILWQNYPNPFNPATTIEYDIPKFTHVTMIIYDILGRKIETLVDTERLVGHYKVTFDASKLPSGVYFYRLAAGSFVQTKKLMVIK